MCAHGLMLVIALSVVQISPPVAHSKAAELSMKPFYTENNIKQYSLQLKTSITESSQKL
jgi:hypothetical protein